MQVLPVLLKDGYKAGHIYQYPEDTTMVYSNFTARKGRPENPYEGIIFFGLQYFVQEYLISQFKHNFFTRNMNDVISQYKRRMDNYLGPDAVTTDHIRDLWLHGCLPIKIKALPEGSFVPYGVPVLTIQNTLPEFYWVTNMLETLMSNVLWMASTSATTAFEFRKVFTKYAKETVGDDTSFVPWQGHDFSFRGLPGVEAAMISGAAHLLSFTGTDTIPAIDFLEEYYGADSDKELVGGSVPATEHSVMCMGMQDGEFETFKRLITEIYPSGIVSIVSDTWDLWEVVKPGGYLERLKPEILARDGKVVIRPDSGDPVKIVCGLNVGVHDLPSTDPEWKGVVECLWDIFGGTTTETGHKLLDSHIGVIYGDGINLDRQERMLGGLKAKGFSSYNVVLGIGSYSYQHVTRDTHGFAMKATAGKTRSQGLVEIYKDPVTDRGIHGAGKKSAKGLLAVAKDIRTKQYTLTDRVTEYEEGCGALATVFEDGKLKRFQTLAEIREIVRADA